MYINYYFLLNLFIIQMILLSTNINKLKTNLNTLRKLKELEYNLIMLIRLGLNKRKTILF